MYIGKKKGIWSEKRNKDWKHRESWAAAEAGVEMRTRQLAYGTGGGPVEGPKL